MKDNTTPLPRVGMARHLNETQWDLLLERQYEVRTYPAKTVLSHRFDKLNYSLLLLEGLVARHVPHPGAGGRHMVALEVPGDFVDLHAFPLKRLDHEVTAVMEAKTALFQHSDLHALIQEHPQMGRALWALTLVDASIHRHWALRNGAMRALARVANLICEIDARLASAGIDTKTSFALPLTQREIGDAVGLTAVHVNRVLRDLREDGCCTLDHGQILMHDRDRLRQLASFDASYLYLPESMSLAEWWDAPMKQAEPNAPTIGEDQTGS